jgi:hypothetical protein
MRSATWNPVSVLSGVNATTAASATSAISAKFTMTPLACPTPLACSVQNGEAEALLKARLAEWQDDDEEEDVDGASSAGTLPEEEQVDLADVAAVVTETWRDKPALL